MIIERFVHVGERVFIGVLASNERVDISVLMMIKVIDNVNNVCHLVEANTQHLTDPQLEVWVNSNIQVAIDKLKEDGKTTS